MPHFCHSRTRMPALATLLILLLGGAAEAKTVLVYKVDGKVVVMELQANLPCANFKPAQGVEIIDCETNLKIVHRGPSAPGGSSAPAGRWAPADSSMVWRSAGIPVTPRDTAAAALPAFPSDELIDARVADPNLRSRIRQARASLQRLAGGGELSGAEWVELIVALEKANLLERLGLGSVLAEKPAPAVNVNPRRLPAVAIPSDPHLPGLEDKP